MKYCSTFATLFAVGQKLCLAADSHTQFTWMTVNVHPPQNGCCTTEWVAGCENTIQNALMSVAGTHTVLALEPGIYCNAGWRSNHSSSSSSPSSVRLPILSTSGTFSHQFIATIDSTSHIAITAANTSDVPRIRFDGLGAFLIRNSNDVNFSFLDISGPALDITGVEATANRVRVTGRGADGCGQFPNHADCHRHSATHQCMWSTEQSYCSGASDPYYNGQAFSVYTSTGLTFTNLTLHHCPSAAIHTQESDDVTFSDNLVYGNTWWTTHASTAVAFAQCEGTGKYTVTGNVVYGNRNFMPFYMASHVVGSGSDSGNPRSGTYGTYKQNYIVDGQGIYATRSQDYRGTFVIQENVVFDNGINGISIQKTAHPSVTVRVENNQVFHNGRTSTQWEGRQHHIGGVVMNSGGATITATATMINNLVSAEQFPDRTFQCFGDCVLTRDSQGNTHCGGTPNSIFPQSAFRNTNCSVQDDDFRVLKSKYPDAQMPNCPQYTPFTEADGYHCQ